jgi:site-specific recombinase XerD
MADCRLSACAPAGDRVTFRDFGSIRVFGKSKSYGPARPRTVYAIGLFKWLADVLDYHQAHVMPLFTNGDGDRMFTTEDGSPLDPAYVSKRFKEIRQDAGLPEAVTAHGMRRLYATTCVLHGLSGWFVSQQLGHESITTTQQYIKVPDDFVDRTVRTHQKEIMDP